MRNEKEEVQYIWHDGATIKVDLLISMSKMSGSMFAAERNLLSLYRQVLIDNGLGEYVKIENELRSFYHAELVPVRDGGSSSAKSADEDAARKLYAKLKIEERKLVLKASLEVLLENHQNMFKSKNDWIGIYLVIRDRVNGSLSMADFYSCVYAIVEEWWPKQLMIGHRTMSNYARCVDYADRQEAYYDMECNPWEMLCKTFWEILKHHIMTYK